MSRHVERRSPAASTGPDPSGSAHTLVDLMYDGFYALFLLKGGSEPKDREEFVVQMKEFLSEVDTNAAKLGVPPDEVREAKYAYCAAVDEIVLRSNFAMREAWERRPLQLRVFGDQLAGEHFFDRLEALRARGNAHLQSLEVFQMCLLLGFEGKFALDQSEKLSYLRARLGDEIARMHGKNGAFAPHAERPDEVANKLGSDTSLWVLGSVFALAALCAFVTMRASLAHEA